MRVALIYVLMALGAVQCNAAKSVLLLAGPPSHAKGEHEFAPALNLLAKSLNESGIDIKAEVLQGFPKPERLAGTDCVFIYSDGQDKHIAKGHLDTLRDYMADGGNIGVIHYALEPASTEMARFLDNTIGGHFQADYSVNPKWRLEKPILADHPITRGVDLGQVDDEWYYHISFAAEVEPVLQAHPPLDSLGRDGPRSGNPKVRATLENGAPQTLAWARHMESGGRAFGFTGGHYLFNFGDDGYRRLLLNAICWTAGAEVPENGIDSEVTPIPRYPSIDQAIARGALADVKRHIAANAARLQSGSNDKLTPLHQAILRRQEEVALFLIDRGASVNQVDSSLRTPLHMAVERKLPGVISALLDAGADPDLLDRNGWTPLHHAAAKNSISTVKALIEGGADPMRLSIRGGTALHEVAPSGSVEIAKSLLDAGADPSVVSETGVTALDIANEYDNKEVQKLLRSKTNEGNNKKEQL